MALLDRCVFLPVAAGLADFVVSAAVSGFMTPAQAGGVNGATYSYVASSSDDQFWEVGRGVYNSGSLTRSTVLFSSFAGAKVNFNSAPTVAIDALAEDIVIQGGPFTGFRNDTTSITGAGALTKFYTPSDFGSAATGILDKINRGFVGGATASSGDIVSGSPSLPSTPSWLDTLFQEALIGEAQFGVLHTWGGPGIVCASQTKDYVANIGSQSGGSAGQVCVGVNNDLISATPIALGQNQIGVRIAGCTGLTLGFQSDMNNGGSVTVLTPHGGVTAGATFAGLLTSGTYPTLALANVSAALGIGPADGATTRVFNKGFIFFKGGLDSSVGHAGVAVEMARAYSLRWLNDSNAVDAEIWADGSGFNVSASELVCSGAIVGVLYGVGANQVVGARITGWNAPTTGGGSATRGTFDTGATLLVTAKTLAALIADLETHGLIGT